MCCVCFHVGPGDAIFGLCIRKACEGGGVCSKWGSGGFKEPLPSCYVSRDWKWQMLVVTSGNEDQLNLGALTVDIWLSAFKRHCNGNEHLDNLMKCMNWIEKKERIVIQQGKK